MASLSLGASQTHLDVLLYHQVWVALLWSGDLQMSLPSPATLWMLCQNCWIISTLIQISTEKHLGLLANIILWIHMCWWRQELLDVVFISVKLPSHGSAGREECVCSQKCWKIVSWFASVNQFRPHKKNFGVKSLDVLQQLQFCFGLNDSPSHLSE